MRIEQMTSVERRSVEAKRKTLGGFQYLTLAIGCMIGVGWITVVGEWLGRAGPIGTIAGFLLGGVVMAGVAACYAELSSMMPQSGGDVADALVPTLLSV